MRFQFDLLGPLRVTRDGRKLTPGSVKQRLLLAGLLLRPGEIVGTAELVPMLWAGEPPASAAANLRTYVRGLRRVLDDDAGGRERMPSVSGGYLLRLEPGERDLDRFDAAVARGRAALAAGDPECAVGELAAAVDMWRGNPLSDLPLTPALARQVARFAERRLLAEEDYAEAKLAAGAAADVIQRLRTLVEQHPLRQRAWGHLMTALYRTGDPSGALAAFHDARRALAEETGLDPGPELIRRYEDILHHRTPSPGPKAPPRRRPEQLPLAIAGFVGREAELAQLDAALTEGAGGATGVVISVVSGMAGVGKTALALRWAHRVADRFPDGQLYLNLRGYDDVDAVAPADALHSFLEALDVPSGRIPTSTDARIGLYRSLLADRRMLIVLDNARDSAQVRPLLPGTAGCAVLITSRDELGGVVAANGARPLTLDVLTSEESRKLLGNWLGAERLAAEPTAVTDIVDAAGRLPLALSIVAARMAVRPAFPLAAFAAELCPSQTRLDALADGDVRRAFSWSYRALSEPAARLFRLLGLHPGPDLTREAAAALAGESPAAVLPALRELTRLHLLAEHQPGRYTFHDLLRSYAAELAHPEQRIEEHCGAYRRLYDHYLHRAYPAARLLQPQWAAVTPTPRLPTNRDTAVTDRDTALAWFAVERPVLIRVVRQAAETGFETYSSPLAWALTAFLAPRGLWQDQFAIQEIAVRAAEKSGDLSGQAMANRHLARAALRLGRHDIAEHRLQCALELYERIGDLTGQAQTLHSQAELAYERGRPEEALTHGHEALRLNRLAGHRVGEGRTLNAIGYIYATIGDFPRAIARCAEALALQQELDDRNGQAATLDSLGFAHHCLGDDEQAATFYERSIALFRDSADRYHEAETLVRLGDAREAMADPTAAADAWHRAAQIYDSLGDPAADEVRRRLARLDHGQDLSRAGRSGPGASAQ